MQSELTRYPSDNWVPIIEKDVDGASSLPLQIDAQQSGTLGKFQATCRVARAIYLGSAPLTHAAHRAPVPVRDIDTATVLRTLSPIWGTLNVTATRLRGRIESILDWAKVHGHRSGDNPAAWKGNLRQALPKPSAVQSPGQHAAMAYHAVPAFVSELRAKDSRAARALEKTGTAGHGEEQMSFLGKLNAPAINPNIMTLVLYFGCSMLTMTSTPTWMPVRTP